MILSIIHNVSINNIMFKQHNKIDQIRCGTYDRVNLKRICKFNSFDYKKTSLKKGFFDHSQRRNANQVTITFQAKRC